MTDDDAEHDTELVVDELSRRSHRTGDSVVDDDVGGQHPGRVESCADSVVVRGGGNRGISRGMKGHKVDES